MTIENLHSTTVGQHPDCFRIDRTVADVSMAEDGWLLDVEDPHGTTLKFWIANQGWIPPKGVTAQFYHQGDNRRLCAVAIDGRFVFDDCYE